MPQLRFPIYRFSLSSHQLLCRENPETCDNSTLLRRRCRRFHGDGATLILAGHPGRPPFARCQLDAHRLGAAENMPDGRHLAAVTDQEFCDKEAHQRWNLDVGVRVKRAVSAGEALAI